MDWMKRDSHRSVESIFIVWPVTGHSYLQADGVFVRVGRYYVEKFSCFSMRNNERHSQKLVQLNHWVNVV
jgi:hypothetical protein